MAERTRKTRTRKVVKPTLNLLTPIKNQFTSLREKLRKIPRTQIYAWVGLVLIVVFLVYFKNLFFAALVNGQPITRWSVVQSLENTGGSKALEDLITETLILQEGRKQNIVITPTEVEEEFKKLQESVASQGQDFDTALESRDLTREKLKTNIHLNKTLTKLVEKDVRVTEEDIKTYLETNKQSLSANKDPLPSEEELKKLAEEDLKNEKQSNLAQELVTRLRQEARIDYWINY